MSCSILKYIKYDQYYYKPTPVLETLAWLHHGSQVIGIRIFITIAFISKAGRLVGFASCCAARVLADNAKF